MLHNVIKFKVALCLAPFPAMDLAGLATRNVLILHDPGLGFVALQRLHHCPKDGIIRDGLHHYHLDMLGCPFH